MAPGALHGVRALDLTCGVAGPVAGMLLADLGAEVVKIHPPGGGPSPAEPGRFMWDRGKRAAVLDPDRPADWRALDRLVQTADVVLVGTSGNAVRYTDLCRRDLAPGRPAFWIVLPPYLLDETPWAGGEESPGLLFSWLGHAWSQSSYQDRPVDCVFPVPVYMQGIWAATLAVALLVGRRRGHRLAPLGVAGGALGAQLVSPGAFSAARDMPHVHRPNGPGGMLPNYRCYRCADGQWLFLGAYTTAFIERTFTALGAHRLLQDRRVGGNPARVRLPENVVWLVNELEEVFRSRRRAHWLALLRSADVPAAAVADPGNWLDHEQVRALGLRLELPDDTGRTIVMPGGLIAMSETPVTVRSSASTSAPAITDLAVDWAPRAPATAEPVGPARRPLDGIRVLDLGTIIAGPYAGTLLGELGAEVTKVERPPAGDEYRTADGGRGDDGFPVYNRGQRSVMLDLRSDRGRAIFRRLAERTDVVIDNYRVGVLGRLGLDHQQLATVNPLITNVSISAFGESGPLGRRPGFDPLVQAVSGIMRAQGGPDQNDSPVFLTVPINDVLTAGLAALGACAALYVRDLIGAGQQVDLTLCAAACLVQSANLVQLTGRSRPAVGGRDFAGPGPLDRLYRTADGWVRLGGTTSDAVAGAFHTALLPDVDQLPADGDAIADAIARLASAQVLRLASAAGLPAVRARQVREVLSDRKLADHGLLLVVEPDQAGGARVAPGRWLHMPGLCTEPPRHAPDLDEHGRDTVASLDRSP